MVAKKKKHNPIVVDFDDPEFREALAKVQREQMENFRKNLAELQHVQRETFDKLMAEVKSNPCLEKILGLRPEDEGEIE